VTGIKKSFGQIRANAASDAGDEDFHGKPF